MEKYSRIAVAINIVDVLLRFEICRREGAASSHCYDTFDCFILLCYSDGIITKKRCKISLLTLIFNFAGIWDLIDIKLDCYE